MRDSYEKDMYERNNYEKNGYERNMKDKKMYANFVIEILSKFVDYDDKELDKYFTEFKVAIKLAVKIAISFMRSIEKSVGDSSWKNFDPEAGEMILPPVVEEYLNGNFSEHVIVKCRRKDDGSCNYAGLGNADGTYEIIGYMNILDEVWFDPSTEEVIGDDVIAWKRYK